MDYAKTMLNICNECPRLFKPTYTCKECGCFMKIKTHIKSQRCPLGKWEAIIERKTNMDATLKPLHMFSEVVWTTTLDVDLQGISEKCIQHKLDNPISEERSNVGGWHSADIANANQPSKPFTELFGVITEHVNEFRKHLAIKESYITYLQSGWILINNHKDSNSLHKHSNSHISGVLYVKTEPEQGSLVFEEGSGIRLDYTGNNLFHNPNALNAAKYKIEPYNGLLVLFPSWYKHMVLPNQTTNDRISISFNYGFLHPLDHWSLVNPFIE